jgi:hypothetical protein
MVSTFPDDADGDALQGVAEGGFDLSKPMSIDFFVAIPDESSGHAVAKAAEAAGFEAEVDQDDESGEWTCYCTRFMPATYEGVTRIQEELRQIAAPYGGVPDGWETAGNVDG